MADGSLRPIETLNIGDSVLAHDGIEQVTTTVLARIVPPPKLVYKLTFSDGNTLTLTDSHPIATPLQEWKSLNPDETKKENPHLPVTKLRVGDTISTIYGSCTLIAIHPYDIVQIYNVMVDNPHTFYANSVLVHNKIASAGGDQADLAHTFTAKVTWVAEGLEHSFMAVAHWAAENLEKAVAAVAHWTEENVIHPVIAAAQWVEENVQHQVTAAAEWIEKNVIHPVVAAAEWTAVNLTYLFTGHADWVGKNLEHVFEGVATWIGKDLEHTFTAAASWVGIPGFAGGVENYSGGPAFIAESGPELVMLPSGSSVYPLSTGASVPSINPVPLASGTGAGGSSPQSINLTVHLDGQAIISAMGIPLSQNIRLANGLRAS